MAVGNEWPTFQNVRKEEHVLSGRVQFLEDPLVAGRFLLGTGILGIEMTGNELQEVRRVEMSRLKTF